ncbi:MAG: MarR family transcriptional regulator [Firmicutes bacterium]|nr:MarR family transcriptional regulator [Bacillota bacterium]
MFELDDCVSYIATNAVKKVADAFNKKLMALGITRVQWTALFYLGKYKSISQFELAEKMNIKTSTMARLIDRMEREGYVIRAKEPADRRVTKLVLTDKGRDLREKLIPEGERFSKLVSRDISDEEIRIFISVLNKMVENSTK